MSSSPPPASFPSRELTCPLPSSLWLNHRPVSSPLQATHNIEPVQIRAKPPPHFFTGQPNFYVAITTLEKTLLEIQERLRLARCFPLTKDHPKQPKNDFEWRSQEEITLLLGTPK